MVGVSRFVKSPLVTGSQDVLSDMRYANQSVNLECLELLGRGDEQLVRLGHAEGLRAGLETRSPAAYDHNCCVALHRAVMLRAARALTRYISWVS